MPKAEPTVTVHTTYEAAQLTGGSMSVRVAAPEKRHVGVLADLLAEIADAYERAVEKQLDPWDKIVQPIYDEINALRTEHDLWRRGGQG